MSFDELFTFRESEAAQQFQGHLQIFCRKFLCTGHMTLAGTHLKVYVRWNDFFYCVN